MAPARCSHVAMTVPDLEIAETYYRALFDMELITRESWEEDGDRQLPPNKSWADAKRAGIDLYMLALRRGDFVLALFDEENAIREFGLPQYRPLFVGLDMPADEIDRIQARLQSGEQWDADSGGFRDRYGVGWQLSSRGRFVGSGERTGRWIDLEVRNE